MTPPVKNRQDEPLSEPSNAAEFGSTAKIAEGVIENCTAVAFPNMPFPLGALVSKMTSAFGKRRERILRYGIVAAFAFVADISTLILLTEVSGLHYLVSAAFGFCVGLVVNYTLSMKWVFTTSRIQRRVFEFGIVGLIAGVGLLLNEVIIYLATEFADFHYLFSKCIATGLAFFWNYVVRKKLLHPTQNI